MIFVTVGHQMPFDRLVSLVEQWSVASERDDIFAQTGESNISPANFGSKKWLTPAEYESNMDRCTAIVAHAGTGTILQALNRNKPMLVLPRLSGVGETRNDHQVGTARYFAQRGLLLAAFEDDQFIRLLGEVESFTPREKIGDWASPDLLERISDFICGEQR